MRVPAISMCFAVFLLTPALAAEDCQSLDYEGRQQVIRQAPTCDKANALFADCAYGATGDVALGQIVNEKCEADFLAKLNQARHRLYDREIKRCDAKYAKMEGTMYRAMAAGCRADLAQSYSRKFGNSR